MQNFTKQLKHLARFMWMDYSLSRPTFFSTMWWEMLLPPTCATLFLQIKGTMFVSMRHKSYDISKPNLLKLEKNGWSLKGYRNGIGFEPVRCVVPPAPKVVLELVKFGFKKTCTANCSFSKSSPPCTALCKCYAWGCNSCSSIKKSQPMNENEEEDH